MNPADTHELIVTFVVSSMEEIVIVELIAGSWAGQRPYLINRERRILGALKFSSYGQNLCRSIIPGETYLPPPVPDKLNLIGLNPEKLAASIIEKTAKGLPPQRALLELVQGISPLAATELVYRGCWDQGEREYSARRLVREMLTLYRTLSEGQFDPCWARHENKYAPYLLTHLGSPRQRYGTVNELLNDYYLYIIERENTGNLRRRWQ